MLPLMKEARGRGHEIRVFCTDQHLEEKFGKTVDEVSGEQVPVVEVPMGQRDDRAVERGAAIGRGLVGLSSAFDLYPLDCVVLFGDRGETLVGAIAAHQLRIPIVHIQGGDSSGCLDDDMRHAISMLADVHFPSNPRSEKRLRRMGVKGFVRCVGDLHLDIVHERTEFHYLQGLYKVEIGGYDIVLVHPDTNEPENAGALFSEAISKVRCGRVLMVYPCSDQGHQAIIEAQDKLTNQVGWTSHPSIPQRDFHGLLEHAHALIGNSSAGIIECPYFDTPFIEIGNRQKGRYRGDYGGGKAYMKVADDLEMLFARRASVSPEEQGKAATDV